LLSFFQSLQTKAWTGHDSGKVAAAQAIYRYGEVLFASEVRSADRYWHVIEYSTRRQYPVQYKPHVVGILWTTMAQFQTWFGSAAYLAYGIQLLPLTVASEGRDSIEWVRELYQPFADSCDANFNDCRDEGWSVLVLAMLATVGSRDEAIKKALELPSSVFESAGGNGHSLTNTIWYLSTRPNVEDPLVIVERSSPNDELTGDLKKPKKQPSDIPDDSDNVHQPAEPKEKSASYDCSCPDTCDEKALNRFAFGHTCGERIDFLVKLKNHDEWDACRLVGVEFPEHCAACDPKRCSSEKDTYSKDCPPCSKEVCRNDKLNRCPVNTAPFLCTSGASTGGCAPAPWVAKDGLCASCCQLSPNC
jgi:Glycosyl hydrolase family 81 C-terminal domain